MASDLASAIAGPMLPVVSMAISMSALGGDAGTPTVLVSVTEAPGLTVKVPVAGANVAWAGPPGATSTISALRSIAAMATLGSRRLSVRILVVTVLSLSNQYE